MKLAFHAWAFSVFCLGLGHARAQGPAAQPVSQPAPAAEASPAPQQAASGPTLVRLDEAGNIVRYEEGPEEAALKLLTLTPEEDAKAREIVVRRHRDVDALVRSNIPLTMRIQAMKEEGLTQDRVNAFRELGRSLPDMRLRQEYRTAIAGVLQPANAALFSAMTSGYRRSWVNLSQERARQAGKQDALIHHTQMESFTTACEEVRQSVDRQIGRSVTTLDQAMEVLAPTPAQLDGLKPIEEAFTKAAGEAGGVANLPASTRIAYVRALMPRVQEDQRRTLLAAIFAESAAIDEVAQPTNPQTETPPATSPAAQPK